jgi:hypothetical protein
MERVTAYPKNKQNYLGLLKFGRKVQKICKHAGVNLIAYGSLVLLAYTKINNIIVNDIDFLVPESSFKKIINTFEKNKINYKYKPKWHTIIALKGKLKLEIDSIDFWHKNLRLRFRYLDFNGFKVKAVNLDSLTKIYKRASKVSHDNPERNLRKWRMLKGITKS